VRVVSRARAVSFAVGNGTFAIVTVRDIVAERPTTLRMPRAVTR